MPTDAMTLAGQEPRHPAASRRILRLALGTSLALLFSQAVQWPLSFLAPVLTMFILALPFPAPSLKQGIVFMVALLLPMLGGMLFLLPFLLHARWAGILLLTLALYYSFYFTARGGSAALGTFMTVGLTLVVTIGSVYQPLMPILIKALAAGAATGMVFVWLAHALLPDLPPDPALALQKKAAKPKPELSEARRNAFRSLMIVLPLTLVFLFSSASVSYTVVMIKVATMGQQASSDESRKMGRSLLESTIWGGLAATLAWSILSMWPSLILYTLLIALAALLFGRGIFKGPAVHPDFSKWTYAFLTMFVILSPAVMDGPMGGGTDAAFWTRFFLFIVIAVYGTVSVAVFDAFFPKKSQAVEASIRQT